MTEINSITMERHPNLPREQLATIRLFSNRATRTVTAIATDGPPTPDQAKRATHVNRCIRGQMQIWVLTEGDELTAASIAALVRSWVQGKQGWQPINLQPFGHDLPKCDRWQPWHL